LLSTARRRSNPSLSALLFAALASLALPHGADAQVDQLARTPSRFATFEGHRVHFKSLGTGRTAVVFVHCWACDLTVWRHQIEAVAGRARVVVLDLPGHGRSAKPDVEYSMAYFARAVDAVLEAAEVSRAVLVGHSMGVPVVREYYRMYPAKVLGLVVVDGALRRPPGDSAAYAAMIARFEGPEYRAALEASIKGMYPDDSHKAVRDAVLAMARGTPQHVVVGAMRGMLDPRIWRDDPIRVRTLVVVAKGPNWPPDYRAYVERLVPEVEYEEMEGVSHFLMLEQPDEFNARLIRFLSELGVLR